MTTKLEELCLLIVDCEHKTAPTQADGYPSIRTPNIGRGRFILDGVNRVSEETYNAWTRRAVPQEGDLIMAREAPVGNVACVPAGLSPCLGQRTLLIRPDPTRVDSRFLTYFLLGPEIQHAIHGQTNGATVPHLNMADVRRFPIPRLPPLEEQKRIAAVLGAYDDLIENCERRIKVLDEMARSLYREWFIRNASPAWPRTSAAAVAVENRRNVPKGSVEALPYVGLEHIPRRSLALDAWVISNELGSNKLRFEADEVLFGKIRPYFHKVAVAPRVGVCSADTFVVGATSPHLYGFMVALVSSDEFVAHATATANGAKMPRANWDVMMQFQIAMPPESLTKRFDDVMRLWLSEQKNLVARMHNLRATRDLLLPRLISGQLAPPRLVADERKQ